MMGRLIVVEALIESQINSILKEELWSIGLLIGQVSSQKDYAVHLVRTPPPEGSAGSKAKYPNSLHHMDESWVVFHAKQVLKMLIGGVSIIGIFAQAPSDMMKGAQMKLKQIIYTIHRMQTKALKLVGLDDEPSKLKYLLQICSTTKKISCRTFDGNDSMAIANVADWKYLSFVDRWVTLNSSLSVDIVIPIDEKDKNADFSKQLQSGLLPTYQRVCKALATLDNKIVDEDALLVSLSSSHQLQQIQQQSKKSRSKTRNVNDIGGSSSEALAFNINLFGAIDNTQDLSVTANKCCSRLYVRGTIQSAAFVHNKATVHEAVQAIKCDMIRSIRSRCELLCDELVQENDVETEGSHVHETPRRVFGMVPSSGMRFCDYMFPDEVVADSVERFQTLLDLVLTEQDIQVDVESLPADEDLLLPDEFARLKMKQAADVLQKPANSNLNTIALIAGGVLAATTAMMSYLYLGEET